MALRPVHRRSVPEDVFDQVMSDVLSGEMQPGETLPSERRLAEVLGVSRPAIREALKRLAAAGLVEVRQGGSTLTQQLARAIFLSPRKTLSRKVNEALVAFEIERRYSKDQILTMYANEIYLGHGNYGVEAACRYYFGKSVKDVTLPEAAVVEVLPPFAGG